MVLVYDNCQNRYGASFLCRAMGNESPVDGRGVGATSKDTGIARSAFSSFITNGGKVQINDIRTRTTQTSSPSIASVVTLAKEIF